MRKRGDDSDENLSDYQADGENQARTYLDTIGTRPGVLHGQALRDALHALEGDHWFQTTMADFWLGLTETTGKARRRQAPPASPFSSAKAKEFGLRGKAQVALKHDILDWDRRWKARVAIEGIADDLGKRKDRASKVALQSIHDNLPVLIDTMLGVVGVIGAVPSQAFATTVSHTEQLEIRSMRLVDALRMRWIDDEERQFWIDRLRQANRDEEAELERLADQDRAAKAGDELGAKTAPARSENGRRTGL